MIIVDVWVPGAAKTKGSMVARSNGSMKESVIGSSQWRALMAQAVRDDIARRHCTGGSRGYACEHKAPFNCDAVEPYAGAVAVTMTAYLTEPTKFVPWPWLWPIWERAGDVDKLARNVLDALGSKSKNPKVNGGAIVDDNLVCRLIAEKVVAGAGTCPAGVRILVETL